MGDIPKTYPPILLGKVHCILGVGQSAPVGPAGVGVGPVGGGTAGVGQVKEPGGRTDNQLFQCIPTTYNPLFKQYPLTQYN